MSLTIGKSEGGDSISSSGKGPRILPGNGRRTSLDVSSSSADISGGLGSLDAFSRLGSPVKSPGGTPKDPPELLEEALEPQDRTPLDRTPEDPGRQDPPRTLALVCGARGASKVARPPREEAGRMCVCVCAPVRTLAMCVYVSRCVGMCVCGNLPSLEGRERSMRREGTLHLPSDTTRKG